MPNQFSPSIVAAQDAGRQSIVQRSIRAFLEPARVLHRQNFAAPWRVVDEARCMTK